MLEVLFGNLPKSSVVKFIYFGNILMWFVSLIWGTTEIIRSLLNGTGDVGSKLVATIISSVIYLLLIGFVSRKVDKSFNR